MRIAVLGAGALGTLFAEGLRAVAEVRVVDRSRAPLGPGARADVALVCVKSPGTRWAAETAERVLEPEGVAVTLQNGLGNLELLADALGPARAAQGTTSEGARFEAEKVVRAGTGRTVLAPHPEDRSSWPRLVRLADRLNAAGFPCEVVEDARGLLWRKLAANAAINPLTALLRISNGELLTHRAGPTADALAREGAAVARAVGIDLSDEDAVANWREVASATFDNRSSMLQDVARGAPTEIDAICGAIAREGTRLGVPTPLNSAMSSLLP